MDPYLESPVIWSGVHHRLITYISDALNLILRPRYVANIGERLYIVQPEGSIIPDIYLKRRRSGRRATKAQTKRTADTEVIDPPLQDREREGPAQVGGEEGEVVGGQLVLEGLGCGGHDRRPAREDGGHEVGEGLAGAGRGLDHQLTATVEGFDKVGYPVQQGQYRLLEIGVGLGTETTTHEALEFCWPKQGHCVVLDPAVTFLDTMVQNRRRLQAEGWNVKIKLNPVTSKSTCQLASHRGYIGITYTWGAYTVTYKDIFGVTLVQKSLGGQQSGLRCDSSCHPAPYGYSNSSSCYGNLGYTCACGNAFGSGNTGGTGKSISETKCTHQLFTASQASVSIKDNFTASVSLNWTVNGGVDSNGGSFLDTCGFF